MKITDLINKIRQEKAVNRNKIILVVLACLLIVYLDFSLIIRLQFNVIRSAGMKITKLKKDLNSFTRDKAAIEEIKHKNLNAAKQGTQSKVKKIISEEGIPLLLQDISDMANKNSIKIIQIRPLKDPKQKQEVIPGAKFLPIRIMLELRAGYHSLGSLINSMEDAPILLVIDELKIEQDPNDYLSQNVNLVLKTYVKK